MVVLGLLMAMPSEAQVKFGVKGGLNVTDMSLSGKLVDADNRAGFFIGPTMKFTLPIVGLGIDASALYDQRSAKLDVQDADDGHRETIKQRQIAIPVNVRYGWGLSSVADVFLFAGPQFGFAIGDKDQSLYEDVADWKLKTSNFSVNVGVGATLLSHLQLTANYNIACGKTGEITFHDATRSAIKGRSNSWQIAAVYYF